MDYEGSGVMPRRGMFPARTQVSRGRKDAAMRVGRGR